MKSITARCALARPRRSWIIEPSPLHVRPHPRDRRLTWHTTGENNSNSRHRQYTAATTAMNNWNTATFFITAMRRFLLLDPDG